MIKRGEVEASTVLKKKLNLTFTDFSFSRKSYEGDDVDIESELTAEHYNFIGYNKDYDLIIDVSDMIKKRIAIAPT